MTDSLKIKGHIWWEIRESGWLVLSGDAENLVTVTGDQMYGERGAGVSGAIAAPTGMKLGQSNTTPSATGAGATLASYLAGSQQAFVTGYPQSALTTGQRQILYQSIWAAGVATTTNPIQEVVIVNDTLADATSVAANTISRALLSNISQKTAGQVLTLTWMHSLQ